MKKVATCVERPLLASLRVAPLFPSTHGFAIFSKCLFAVRRLVFLRVWLEVGAKFMCSYSVS